MFMVSIEKADSLVDHVSMNIVRFYEVTIIIFAFSTIWRKVIETLEKRINELRIVDVVQLSNVYRLTQFHQLSKNMWVCVFPFKLSSVVQRRLNGFERSECHLKALRAS